MTRMMHSFTSLGLPVKDIEAVKKQTSFPTAELQKLQSNIDKFKQELASKESSLQQALNTLEIKEKEVEALAARDWMVLWLKGFYFCKFPGRLG